MSRPPGLSSRIARRFISLYPLTAAPICALLFAKAGGIEYYRIEFSFLSVIKFQPVKNIIGLKLNVCYSVQLSVFLCKIDCAYSEISTASTFSQDLAIFSANPPGIAETVKTGSKGEPACKSPVFPLVKKSACFLARRRMKDKISNRFQDRLSHRDLLLLILRSVSAILQDP